MKKFLLLFLITLLGYSVNAEQITITPTAVSYSDDIISMTTAKNSGGTQPAYNTNGKDVRVYAKGSVTITVVEGFTIDKIVFNISTQGLKRLAPITASAGTVATQASGDNTVTWTGSESSVTFTVGDKADYGSDGSSKAGQLCFDSIVIDYTSQVSDTREAVELSFPDSNYSATLGTAFKSPVLTVTPEAARSEVKFATSNENVATVDNSGNVTLIANGNVVITASISDSETYKNAKAEYTLNVIDPNAAISVTLDPEFFNYTTTSYGAAAQTDNYGVAYSTVYYYNGGNMQYNTNNSNGKGSGITVTSNNSDYIIKSIDIEMTTVSTSGLGLNVYASDNAFDTLVKATAPTIPSSATKLNDAIIQASTTININAKAFALIPSTKGVIAVQKVTVYYALDTTLGKENVEVTFDGGDMNVEFEEGKTLQGRIASADVEDLTFSYSSDDTDVATVDNNGMLTLVGAGSTVITATVNDEFYTGHASYTLTVTGVYKNFNEIIANAKVNEEIVAKFPMTVGYVNGKYVFVADNQGGYMLIYGSTTYAAGDVIPAGMTATYTIYNGLPELMPTTTPESTEKGEYEIATVAAADVLNQPLNKIVKVVDVNFAAATPDDKQNFTGTVDETSLKFYNQMTLASVEAGTYDVTLIVSTYTKGATEIQTPNQLQPIEYAAVPTAPKVIIDDAEVDTDTGYELQGHDVVVYLTAQEGATIWYKFTAVNTDQNEAATMSEDGFSEYPAEGITIGQLGTLEYYSELNGRTSAIASLQFKGIPTGINEIEAQTGAGTEWFDLSGRRVAAPSKGGIYIKKTGSEVSKYAF